MPFASCIRYCFRVTPTFSAHNIRLDDGSFTRSPDETPMDEHPWFVSAMRVLDTVYGSDKAALRLADLGCLEGGFTVAFARKGFQAVGVEVRASNVEACTYVKSRTDLPSLSFVQDDVWNIAAHGNFDVMFCAGLLYHIDDPKRFMEMLSSCTSKVLILHTHFAVETNVPVDSTRRGGLRGRWQRPEPRDTGDSTYNLGPMTRHEGLRGRWYTEFADDAKFKRRDDLRWASWENHRSFWIQREFLLGTIRNVGFDLVFEQFDSLGADIAQEMTSGYYATHRRGMFVGIKT